MMRIRNRYMPEITLPVKKALLVCFNTQSRSYSLLPEPTPDIADKMIALKSERAFEKYDDSIEQGLVKSRPALMYWMVHQFAAPVEIRSEDRFGIVPYLNPEIRAGITETGKPAQLEDLLEQFMATGSVGRSGPRKPHESLTPS